MQEIFKNKKVLVIIAAVVVVAVIVTLAIVFTNINKPNGGNPIDFQPVSIESDPVSGVELETTAQEPEIVKGPMFLGFEDLYRNRSGDWVNNAKEAIQRFVADLGIEAERISVAEGSFNNTGDNYDPLTSTTFYFVINNSGETYKVEAQTLPGAEYSYDIYNQAGEKLRGDIFKTAV
jgi:uncharacterized protein YxeA